MIDKNDFQISFYDVHLECTLQEVEEQSLPLEEYRNGARVTCNNIFVGFFVIRDGCYIVEGSGIYYETFLKYFNNLMLMKYPSLFCQKYYYKLYKYVKEDLVELPYKYLNREQVLLKLSSLTNKELYCSRMVLC